MGAATVVALVAGSVAGPAFASVTIGTAGEFVSLAAPLVNSGTGVGTPKGPFAAMTSRTIQVTGAVGIPTSGVSAVMVAFIAATPADDGQMSAGPADGALSGVMRYNGGAVTTNSAVVSVSASGAIQVRTTTSSNVDINVQGYYTAGNGVTAAGGYSPVAQTRIVDTINGVGLPKATISGGQTVTIQVSGTANVPTGSSAAFVNFQVDNTSTVAGSINPYATSATSRPPVTLNFPGDTPYTSIGAIVPLDANGQIHLYLSTANTINLLMDVEGYFTAGSANGTFTPAVGKIYDSRVAPAVAVRPGQTVTVPVAGTNGLPATTDGFSSAVINLTAIDGGTAGGYARAYADGTKEPTNVGTMTFDANTAGTMSTNLATVPVGLDGAVELHNVSADTVNYIVDLEGFYTNTSSTMCANDADNILGAAAVAGSATVGADQGSPVVSAVVTNSLNNDVDAQVFVVDSNGNPVGDSPSVDGTLGSGNPLVYHLPTDTMTAGNTYTWWVHAFQDDACASSATSPHHTFTLGAAPTATAPATSTLTVSGSALAAATAAGGATDCQGSPCTLTQGAMAVGSDGSLQHVTGIKANLSALPAGARLVSATLTLAPTCFGTACMSGTLSIAEANTDVTTVTTGADLAALDASTATPYPETVGTSTYDVTGLVQDWSDGTNNGAILTETNTNSGATGETFAGPAAATNPAKITIVYRAATVPDPVTNLMVTAGDGGLIAAWAPPANTGWYDTTGATEGLTGYTVTVKTAGSTVATQTVTGPRAVFTGLTNGTAYSVNVSPTNAIGAGTTATSPIATPVAVLGGPGHYITDVNDLLNAQDALEAGGTLSTQDASVSAADPNAIVGALSTNAASYEAVYTNEYSTGQSESEDRTTLGNTLAVQTGNVVTVYTTANEAFTTVDISAGTEADVPGTDIQDDAMQFTAKATSPTYIATLDAAGLLQPVTAASTDTLVTAPAASSSDPAPSADITPNSPSVSNGFTVNTNVATTTSVQPASTRVNQSAVVAWANSQVNGSKNGYKDDCTDFVSRALHFGGHLAEVFPWWHGLIMRDPDSGVWYDGHALGIHVYSDTWGQAPHLSTYLTSRGGKFVNRAYAKPGDVEFGDLYGSKFSKIDHAAVVSLVKGGNIYVDQHSVPRHNEPIYKVKASASWQSKYPSMHVWLLDTSGLR